MEENITLFILVSSGEQMLNDKGDLYYSHFKSIILDGESKRNIHLFSDSNIWIFAMGIYN